MNKFFIALAFMLTLSTNAMAQAYSKHTVSKGETITQIAARYKVTPYDIYRINPDAQAGIKEKDVILIPESSIAGAPKPVTQEPPKAKATAGPGSGRTHTAEAKETLYSISRKYGVSVDAIKNLNGEQLKDGLKVGQTIRIPDGGSVVNTSVAAPKTEAPKAETAVTKPATPKATVANIGSFHVVAAKETKFGIAKKYGITVAELEKQNPGIVAGLPIGYKLSISGGAAAASAPTSVTSPEKPKPVVTEMAQKPTMQAETVKSTKFAGFANYEVKPKETLFSLAKDFDITQDELLTLNPSLKDGVKVGMILKVPGRGSMTLQPAPGSGKIVDLTRSISGSKKKQLVLLLPFNAAKIQGDTAKSIGARLKKDAFLNMTLDFYSGALMAIDSARVLGANIDVHIFDSEETKASSNVAALVEKNNLAKADAIIGPFYQQYAEKVAELVASGNVPVISPLSKDEGKPMPNLYQSMPPIDYTKMAMLDYLKAQKGNIIVVSDPKRVTNKEFIGKNCAEARFVTVAENGAVDIENLKSLLSKDLKNYVVLDTEKTGMILSTTNALLGELATSQIQIAIIEPNETLDFEEVSMKRLTILRLLYPSLTRENHAPEAQLFENAYKNKNKIFPSQFAVRGFDLTFDTMTRLSQGKPFAEMSETKTHQVESQFEYAARPDGGFSNKGVYILEYQEDLSVKQMN